MSTATEVGVDELVDIWGLASPDDADPCEMIRRATQQTCPREAVYIVRWGPADVGHGMSCLCRRTTRLCLWHGEKALRGRLSADTVFFCRVCDKLMIAVHVDRLRRTA